MSFLGLAKKAGKLEIGEEPVGAACRSRKASIILLASDAAENSVRRAAHFGEAGHVLQITLPLTKDELGASVGRATCAMLALTDIGFAAALLKKLAVLNPDTYGLAEEQLVQKSVKVLQRQKEQRAHEKNLLRGKKNPWAPQPGNGKKDR